MYKYTKLMCIYVVKYFKICRCKINNVIGLKLKGKVYMLLFSYFYFENFFGLFNKLPSLVVIRKAYL